ncbi:FG-GAP and VCBS repeat-containing protein [Streptomyces sp. NPDC050145]|uniref:FG-GAP and VCBS repeat-containing protein n=1 Tax=Streptomyces sp. NPDC050145 TaxID=3365602 RepID=UPI00379EAA2E
MRARTLALATTALLATGLLFPATATAATARYADDFNGDGYRDYAYPSFSDGDGGSVAVVFGTASGPGTADAQRISQASPGVPGADEDTDEFGEVRAAADFDQDGYGDLAVAAVNEKNSQGAARGAVTILWGSPKGLATGTTVANKNPVGGMGQDLATGDFNGDGHQDLALVNGAVTYVYRGPFTRSGTTGTVTKLDKTTSFYSTALISGKVNGDGKTDLVIIGDVVTSSYSAADAWFIKGGSSALTSDSTLRLASIDGDVGRAELGGDGVIADFDKDGYGDITVGTPLYSRHKGRLTVWKGSSSGPSTSTRITQSSDGMAGTPENYDNFASSISAGDVNGDGYQDLAIGVRSEAIDGKDNAGGVHVLKGRASGLSGTGSQWFARNTPGVPGPLNPYDAFGDVVRLRDANGDGTADLYVDGGDGSLRLPGSATGITTVGVTDIYEPPVSAYLQ